MSSRPGKRSTIARHVRVTGRVQGVYFRGWTKDQADALGVAGWIRNWLDGSVEALLSGDDHVVAQLIERMRRGPPAAHVMRIDENEATPAPVEGFAILRG